MEKTIHLSEFLFQKIVSFFYKESGILLKDYKKYLVEYRLSKFVGKDKEFSSYEEFYEALLNDKTGELKKALVQVLTTNYTYFFREDVHFEFVKNYLKDRADTEAYLRIWSAACSTGEEAYSIAISCFEALGNPYEYDLKILATDISLPVLRVAIDGVYHYSRMSKGTLDDKILRKYFIFDKENKDFIVKPEVKNLVSFRYLNLMDVYPFLRKFDIVFLRNVLIYFDNNEKKYILDKIYDVVKNRCYLILGLSETIVGVNHKFKLLKNSIYLKE